MREGETFCRKRFPSRITLLHKFFSDGDLGGALGDGETECNAVHNDETYGDHPHFSAEGKGVEVRPTAVFFSDEDDHGKIDEGIKHGGDDAVQRLDELKVIDGLEKDETDDSEHRAEEVQEEVFVAEKAEIAETHGLDEGTEEDDDGDECQGHGDRPGKFYKERPARVVVFISDDIIDAQPDKKPGSKGGEKIGQHGKIPEAHPSARIEQSRVPKNIRSEIIDQRVYHQHKNDGIEKNG